MFKKRVNGVKTIYLLDGVNALLTSPALVYKRNLMYSSFLCLCLSLLAPEYAFQSLFGFKFKCNYIETGSIVIVLMFIISYELIMLWTSFSQCKSQWFGKNPISNGDVEFYKDKIEVNLNSNMFIDIDRLLVIQDLISFICVRNDDLQSELNPIINELLIKNKNIYNDIKDKVTLFDDRFIEIKKSTDGYHMFRNDMKNHSSIYSDSMRVINEIDRVTNENIHFNIKSWFVETSNELNELKKYYHEFTSKIYGLEGGYNVSLLSDFILPTIFSLATICVIFY